MDFNQVVSVAVSELHKQISSKKTINTRESIEQTYSIESDIELTSWLAEQTVYPKFFWRSRNKSITVLGLGNGLVKDDDDAVLYLQSSAQHDDANLYYVSSFDNSRRGWSGFPRQRVFRPALEILLSDHKVTLTLNDFSDKAVALALLEQVIAAQHTAGTRGEKSQTQVSMLTLAYRKDQPCYRQWQHQLEQVQQRFTTDMTKVVLARETQFEQPDNVAFWPFFSEWMEHTLHSYAIGLQLDAHRGFVSFSPERLFSREKTQLNTEALAGTVSRSNNAHDDNDLALSLLHDKKNGYEHQLVIDDIKEKLQRVNIQPCVDNTVGLVKLRSVQHLYCPIKAELTEDMLDINLIQTLHPTAAVCGLPEPQVRQFIREHEQFNRGWYAGCFGMINQDKSDVAVSIRCARIDSNSIFLYAGAGIVPDSQAAAEWQELNHKIATPLALFNAEVDVVSCPS